MIRRLASPVTDDLGQDAAGNRTSIALVVLAVIAALAVSALLVVFLYYCYIRFKVKKTSRSQRFKEEAAERALRSVSLDPADAQVFTFKQLQTASCHFSPSNVIGHGGFGSVYRGVLPDGRTAAIKQLDRASKQGDHEFRVEVDMLSRSSFIISGGTTWILRGSRS